MGNGPSPYLDLNNGVSMPALGLGVFLSPPKQTADAVETAIENGYRLIDTAAAYDNEREVGQGIRRTECAQAPIRISSTPRRSAWRSATDRRGAVVSAAIDN